MATTYEAIATVTVGGAGAANIEFTSIPADWTDLVLKLSARTDRTSTTNNCFIQFNNNTSAVYSNRNLQGDGSSATSSSDASAAEAYIGAVVGNTATASTFGNLEIYIPNYAGSTNKSFSSDQVNENNATAAISNLVAGLWANTAAITSLKINAVTFNFVQYTTATLYGIKNS
jgi:hypothetical protein